MSIRPIFYSQLSALKRFVRLQPRPLLPATIAITVILVIWLLALSAGGTPIPKNKAPLTLLSALLPLLVAATVTMAAFAVLWRWADRRLLRSASPGGLPKLGAMLRTVLFLLLALGGMVVLAWALLIGVAPRLAGSYGFAELPRALGVWDRLISYRPGVYLALLGGLAVLYLPVFNRLLLLGPGVSLDNSDVSAAWKLILKTTAGRGIPLALAALFQVLCLLPFLFLLRYLDVASPFLQLLRAPLGFFRIPLAELVALVLALLVVMFALALLTALQAAAGRHFFGFVNHEEDEQGQHKVVEEPLPTEPAVASASASPTFDETALVDDESAAGPAQPVYQPAPLQHSAPVQQETIIYAPEDATPDTYQPPPAPLPLAPLQPSDKTKEDAHHDPFAQLDEVEETAPAAESNTEYADPFSSLRNSDNN